MSRISHANLVRLVGVSVNHMPWLVVLEFMRYGDLRNLVVRLLVSILHAGRLNMTAVDGMCREEDPAVCC
jgi:hypothetical protein